MTEAARGKGSPGGRSRQQRGRGARRSKVQRTVTCL